MSAGASKQVKSAAQALLPPIQLLRRLLRAHRDKLSPEMRSLGDNYVKDEFKRHQKIDNPLHIVGFLSQWKLYLDALEQGDTGEAGEGESHIDAASKRYFRGKRLDPETMEKVRATRPRERVRLRLTLGASSAFRGAALSALRAHASD
jgi:Complex1_LYR-like